MLLNKKKNHKILNCFSFDISLSDLNNLAIFKQSFEVAKAL